MSYLDNNSPFTDYSNNRTSVLVSEQLPEFVTINYPLFQKFCEAYYEYLEQNGNLTQVSKNFPNFLDIDYVVENNLQPFINQFSEMYLNTIPTSVLTDKAKLIKHIKNFYSSRGTDKSFQFLFRILFNEDVNLFDTGTQVLKLSDGKWYQPPVIRIQSQDPNLDDWLNLQIFGANSYASAIVESVNYSNPVNNEPSEELVLSHLTKNFTTGEVITANNGTTTLTATVLGIVNSILVTNGGSAYNVGDYVPIISQGSGMGANAQISVVSSGSITSIYPTDGGAGFQAYPNFTVTISNSRTPVQATIIEVDTSGTYQPNTYYINDDMISSFNNTVLSNVWSTQINQTFSHWVTYANTGPIYFIDVEDGGQFSIAPSINISQSVFIGNSNTSIASFGSIGTFKIISGGENYVANDQIIFTNIHSVGFGAEGVVSSVNATGAITGALVALPSITGTVNVTAGNNIIVGTGTLFTQQLTANNLANTPNSGTYIVVNGEQHRVNVISNNTILNVSTNFAHTANNVKLRLSGYMLGGIGYSQNDVLTNQVITNLVSANGTGGVVVPDAVLGGGEILNASQGAYGIIEAIQMVTVGNDYIPTNPPLIDLTHLGDGQATAIAQVIGGVYYYPGYYIGEDGLLSSRRYFQNLLRYNNYSYQITSPVLVSAYRDLVYNILNPVGMNMITVTEIDSSTNSLSVLNRGTDVYITITSIYGVLDYMILGASPFQANIG